MTMHRQDDLENIVTRTKLSMSAWTKPTNDFKDVRHQTTSNPAEGISPHPLRKRSAFSIEMTITMRATSQDRHKMKHELWRIASCCDI